MTKRTAIIGGGAAGFFLAINLKEMCPKMNIAIFERSNKVLSKVKISGGGRCNCTNSFENVDNMMSVYPRGHRLMKRLFHTFDNHDTMRWFEYHGVALTTQDDHCVFPKAQDSQVIIDCFMKLAKKYDIDIYCRKEISSLNSLKDYDYVAVTTGGSPRGRGLEWLRILGHETTVCVPSLFSLNIDSKNLRELMGTVVNSATVFLPGLKYRSNGPLLITHWGVSGPAILKLSSHGALVLHDHNYNMPLFINWISHNENETLETLLTIANANGQKLVSSIRPYGLPQRLWDYLVNKALIMKTEVRWNTISKKDFNRMVNTLCCDKYDISGRGTHKEEFVTCGGIALNSIDNTTMRSKYVENMYFAGEVLDIDGITGGFNFQAAWTTAYVAAKSIALKQ